MSTAHAARTLDFEVPVYMFAECAKYGLESDDPAFVGRMSTLDFGGQYAYQDKWVRVGNASVTLRLVAAADIVPAQVEALKKAKASVLAEAQAKATEIEGEIQKLLAITHEVTG